jgi:general secretion pathway protein D
MLKYSSLFLIAALSLALIASASLNGSIPLAPIEAQNAPLQNPTVRIDPAQSVVDVGETFTVTVMIDDANDLGAFQFDMLYITTTVTVDSVSLGDFLGSTGRTVIPVGPIIDNQAGRVAFGAATIGSASGPNGTGALAHITLTAQGVGNSPLDLERVQVLDTEASQQIPIVEDGVVVAGGAPTPTFTPTPTTTPTGTATPTPTSTPTTTTTPEPAIIVYPTKAPVGETFTFTGSHFTPDGLIEEWFADPDQARHLLGSFYADSLGGFTRQHSWASYWPAGVYSYIAIDVTKALSTSVEFEMTEPGPQTPTNTPTATATVTATPTWSKVYLPLVLKGW